MSTMHVCNLEEHETLLIAECLGLNGRSKWNLRHVASFKACTMLMQPSDVSQRRHFLVVRSDNWQTSNVPREKPNY